MRRFGNLLMSLGGTLGVLLALSMFIGLRVSGSWLLNLAFAKLAVIGAAGLIVGGAVTARVANRREQRRLDRPPPPPPTLPTRS